jgi:hypothetical protein
MAYASEDVATAAAAAAQSAKDAAAKFNSAMTSLQSQGTGLQIELLAAQGNATGAAALKRKTDIATATEGFTADQVAAYSTLYDANTALAKQVQDAQAAQQAATQAAQQATQAAAQLKSAWQGITDSMFDEVHRIRGLIAGSSTASYIDAQANFSIVRGQAAAGDQNAAKLLPQLSQTLLTLAEANASTLEELQYIRGRTAGSLEGLGNQYASQFGLTIPKLATGTNYVPQDMLAYLHEGEEVTPRAWNPAAGGYTAGGGVSDKRLVVLLQRLVDEAVASREQNSRENAAIARHTSEAASLLEDQNNIGVLTRTS